MNAYLNRLIKQHGEKFQVSRETGIQILDNIVEGFKNADTVDLVDLYKTIGGYDGSTTLAGLAKLKRLYIGKYYMLQGDVFQINANRDYPVTGKNNFTAGNVRLVGDTYVQTNVDLLLG